MSGHAVLSAPATMHVPWLVPGPTHYPDLSSDCGLFMEADLEALSGSHLEIFDLGLTVRSF